MTLPTRQWVNCLINCLSRYFLVFIALFAAGCASVPERSADVAVPAEGKMLIAVLPVENLSGTRASIKDIRNSVIEKMKQHRINVLSDRRLEDFMARNRMRYIGGLTPAISRAFKAQEGVDGVLIVSLELYDETPPPKVSFFARLVSTTNMPEILWIRSAGLAGDDSPGLLAFGEILDPLKLRDRCLTIIVDSLARQLSGSVVTSGSATSGKYAPKISYRSSILDPIDSRRVIVVPFLNASDRKNAGQLVALHFAEQLKNSSSLHVIEPGIVRQELLNLRIIMEDGLSLSDAKALFSVINADLVLTGKVFAYQDYRGLIGTPRVDFSTVVIDNKSNSVVWSSDSYNRGTDGVFFFDVGQVNNAHAMASKMVVNIIRRISHG
jgi:hypothetical protein